VTPPLVITSEQVHALVDAIDQGLRQLEGEGIS
jgi:4-aminobutyrate aminotransferase-like enzyme